MFSLFGPDAPQARKLYDPLGSQTLDELKQQVFADRTFVEPARHFANEMARAGQTVWLYRFAYVSQAQRGQAMGALHGHEIPFVMNIPAALVGKSRVTPTDSAMADLVSAYWVSFALTTDPNGGGRPMWPRHDRMVDRLLHFTSSGVLVGTDPLKSRLDLWERAWNRDARSAHDRPAETRDPSSARARPTPSPAIPGAGSFPTRSGNDRNG